MKAESSNTALPTPNSSWRIGIVSASFYKEETDALIESARDALIHAGLPAKNISFHEAAGSFEIPLIGAALAESGAVDALIGLGIIIQGETKHADLLATEVARGIMSVQLQYRLPFAFEVLWANSLELVQQRLHKGEEAARAALVSLAELERIHS